RIVLMAEGRIVQDGTPADLLRRPADPFVTAFIGEDRGLRTLEHTRLAEVAEPAANGKAPSGPVLPGSLSVLEAGRELARLAPMTGDGFLVGNGEGRPAGYLSFQRFAAVLGETLAPAGEGGEEGSSSELPA
ncbi:MAG: hypothetical protein M3Q10_00400, partial [Chloroflexota bacterium]|nr:hypothetical protein [Chloroflexota bacterium]